MQVQPYLFFDGRCEEAIEFYRRTLGAQVGMLMRWKDSPEPCPEGAIPPGSENKVMHALGADRRHDGDGLGRSLHRRASLPGLLPVARRGVGCTRPNGCSMR